jgi:hypothetical protein
MEPGVTLLAQGDMAVSGGPKAGRHGFFLLVRGTVVKTTVCTSPEDRLHRAKVARSTSGGAGGGGQSTASPKSGPASPGGGGGGNGGSNPRQFGSHGGGVDGQHSSDVTVHPGAVFGMVEQVRRGIAIYLTPSLNETQLLKVIHLKISIRGKEIRSSKEGINFYFAQTGCENQHVIATRTRLDVFMAEHVCLG